MLALLKRCQRVRQVMGLFNPPEGSGDVLRFMPVEVLCCNRLNVGGLPEARAQDATGCSVGRQAGQLRDGRPLQPQPFRTRDQT